MTSVFYLHLVPLLGGLLAVPVLADLMPPNSSPLQVALALLVAALVRYAEMRMGIAKDRQPRRRRKTKGRKMRPQEKP